MSRVLSLLMAKLHTVKKCEKKNVLSKKIIKTQNKKNPFSKEDLHLNHHWSKYIAYGITNLSKPFEHFCKLSINLEYRKTTMHCSYCPKKMHLRLLFWQQISMYKI